MFFYIATTHHIHTHSLNGGGPYQVDDGDGTYVAFDGNVIGGTNWNLGGLSGGNETFFQIHTLKTRFRLEDVRNMPCGPYRVTTRFSLSGRLRFSNFPPIDWAGRELDDPFHATSQVKVGAIVLVQDNNVADEFEFRTITSGNLLLPFEATVEDEVIEQISLEVPFHYAGNSALEVDLVAEFGVNARGAASQAMILGLNEAPDGSDRQFRVGFDALLLS